MTIPFLDLSLINQPYFSEINDKIKDIANSGWYILGKEVLHFEESFAQYCNSKYAIGVGNGLDAIELILKASNLPFKSQVIVPANTYFATILAIVNAGLTPVLVEPDPYTYLIDVNKIEEKITVRTSAILVVELYGKCPDYISLRSLCDKFGLKLFADNAQSHGALYMKRKSAVYPDASAYSFYPTKNLGALGDAGCVITNDKQLKDQIRKTRNYGSDKKYSFQYLGRNSRLDEIQAGVLSLKLKYLDEITLKRRLIAKRYLSEIKNKKISLPLSNSLDEDSWHLFIVTSPIRDELKTYLSNCGIGTEIHYPLPPHKQKALSFLSNLSLPITEKLHRETLSIPLNQSLTEAQIDYIIMSMNSF